MAARAGLRRLRAAAASSFAGQGFFTGARAFRFLPSDADAVQAFGGRRSVIIGGWGFLPREADALQGFGGRRFLASGARGSLRCDDDESGKEEEEESEASVGKEEGTKGTSNKKANATLPESLRITFHGDLSNMTGFTRAVGIEKNSEVEMTALLKNLQKDFDDKLSAMEARLKSDLAECKAKIDEAETSSNDLSKKFDDFKDDSALKLQVAQFGMVKKVGALVFIVGFAAAAYSRFVGSS